MAKVHGPAGAGKGVGSGSEACAATILILVREALCTGTDLEVDFSDEREPSTSDGSTDLAAIVVRMLSGEGMTDADVDAARRAIRQMRGEETAVRS